MGRKVDPTGRGESRGEISVNCSRKGHKKIKFKSPLERQATKLSPGSTAGIVP